MATGRRNFTMTDDDIYTEDDNLDAVLMTAPDAATVAYAGEVSLPMALQIGSTWTHASRTIWRRRYAIPTMGTREARSCSPWADRLSGSHRTDLNRPPPTSMSGGDVKRAISQPGKGPTHGKRIDDRRGLPSRA